MTSREFTLADEAATLALAARCAQLLVGGGIVYLQGQLGMGKTTFARGLLQALGHRGLVKSPTYTLVEPYQLGPLAVYHFDLYRLADPGELEYLGAREAFSPGALCLVEWPERGQGWLPEPDLRISLNPALPGRKATLEATSARLQQQLVNLQI